MKASAKTRLWYWLIGQKNTGNDIILTSSILSWGSTHFSNRACRNARQLCEEHKLERIPRDEALKMGLHTREMAYRIL